MALGRRSESRQEELFVAHDRLPRSEGHAFYRQLNRLLAGAGFDRYVERRCGPHYQPSGTPGRPSIPPGVYFRMLLVGLMMEQGVVDQDEEPTNEEIRRFDKQRKNKKVSNEDWESKTDPDARIAKMKDGRTHLAYKAEHVVDLESELILAAEVYHADQTDHGTLVDSVMEAQVH